MQAYSKPERENNPHSLPDLEIFEMTAAEVAESAEYKDEQFEFMKRHEFRLANMNSRDRAKMIDAMIEELGITGGWYYWFCFPGCMPDSDAVGPFETRAEALKAAQEEAQDAEDIRAEQESNYLRGLGV